MQGSGVFLWFDGDMEVVMVAFHVGDAEVQRVQHLPEGPIAQWSWIFLVGDVDDILAILVFQRFAIPVLLRRHDLRVVGVGDDFGYRLVFRVFLDGGFGIGFSLLGAVVRGQ